MSGGGGGEAVEVRECKTSSAGSSSASVLSPYLLQLSFGLEASEPAEVISFPIPDAHEHAFSDIYVERLQLAAAFRTHEKWCCHGYFLIIEISVFLHVKLSLQISRR